MYIENYGGPRRVEFDEVVDAAAKSERVYDTERYRNYVSKRASFENVTRNKEVQKKLTFGPQANNVEGTEVYDGYVSAREEAEKQWDFQRSDQGHP